MRGSVTRDRPGHAGEGGPRERPQARRLQHGGRRWARGEGGLSADCLLTAADRDSREAGGHVRGQSVHCPPLSTDCLRTFLVRIDCGRPSRERADDAWLGRRSVRAQARARTLRVPLHCVASIRTGTTQAGGVGGGGVQHTQGGNDTAAGAGGTPPFLPTPALTGSAKAQAQDVHDLAQRVLQHLGLVRACECGAVERVTQCRNRTHMDKGHTCATRTQARASPTPAPAPRPQPLAQPVPLAVAAQAGAAGGAGGPPGGAVAAGAAAGGALDMGALLAAVAVVNDAVVEVQGEPAPVAQAAGVA
jgi:hypothetical protein